MERKKMMLAGGLVVAGGLMFFQMNRMNQPAPTPVQAPALEVETVDYKDVLVATADVVRGQRLTPDMMEWKSWPEDSVTTSMILQGTRPQAMEELASAVVRSDVYAGEPVIDAKLVRAGDSGLMAALLSPGMRAVTTRVTVDSAVGGFILPGDRVDVMLTVQLPRQKREQGGTQSVAQYATSTIFANVKVLAVNQVYAAGPESPATVGTPSYATFELNQSDAERLMEAAEQGNLSLTLRGLNSTGRGRSMATAPRIQEEGGASSMVVYRSGQQTQAAIRRP